MLQGPSRLHIALLMLLAWWIIFPVSLWAENQAGGSPPAPLKTTAPNEGVREEFFGRLTDLRSLARRKEAVITQYAGLAQALKESQPVAEEIETKISAIRRSSKNRDATPSEISQVGFLDITGRAHSKSQYSAQFHMACLVEEYDILSRLEELQAGYKTKAITKGDLASENRGLKEELFHLKTAQQLDRLGLDLMEELGELEKRLLSLSMSVH